MTATDGAPHQQVVVRRLQRLWSGRVHVGRRAEAGAMVMVVLTDEADELARLRGERTLPCLWVTSEGRTRRRGGIPPGCDYVMEPDELRGSKGALALRYLLELGSRRVLERRLTSLRPDAQLGRAAAALGHESSTALSVLMTTLDDVRLSLAHAEGMREAIAPGPLLEGVVDACVAARQLARMVADLSTVARADGSVRTLLVGDVVRAAARMESVALTGIEVAIPSGVEHVRADEARLYQVFMNLMRNAAQALEGCEAPRIDITEQRANAWVEVHLRDNGPGLADGAEEQVFRSWFTTRENGTGLGLALCREWLEQMGGRIEARPSDRGAHFVVTLRAAGPTRTQMPTLVPDCRHDAVLVVVEDDPLLRRAMGRALKRLGRVHALASAEEALALLGEGVRIDVLLTDLRLGAVSGKELTERVLTDYAQQVPCVIVVSGDTSMEVTRWTETVGVPWVRKPVGAADLRDVVQHHLARLAP